MNDVLILTTNDCPGARVARVLGPVYGCSVRSRSLVGNLLGGLRAAFGGEQQGYAAVVIETREKAIAALADAARGLGADAVLAMRFDSGEFDSGQGQAMNEVVAYGTAVVFER